MKKKIEIIFWKEKNRKLYINVADLNFHKYIEITKAIKNGGKELEIMIQKEKNGKTAHMYIHKYIHIYVSQIISY